MKNFKYFIHLSIISLLFSCQPCGPMQLAPCGGDIDMPTVDLIVMMDQSSSMNNAAQLLSDAVERAIDSALQICPSDLRVTYLGVDGVAWPNTVFQTSHRDYLDSIHNATLVLSGDLPPMGYAPEQGANAVEDLSELFDWRKNACKAILYISDEELDGVNPRNDLANETATTQNAIDKALENGVAVFTHLIDKRNLAPSIYQNYLDLAEKTGGIHLKTPDSSLSMQVYVDLIPIIICNACNGCTIQSLLDL
ncbi:MAG: hypothetical protein KDD63_22695 [Bacteroidetes bacterium]|nr:hypothetical protein [Bacteroidota bacterium]